MRPQPARRLRIFLFFAFFSLLFALRGFAQTAPVPSRITHAVDEANLTVLKGNTYYLARAEYDRGAAPASLPMNRMLLVLQRSPSQEAALEQLLDQQQDHPSANYHHWLTPQQFGQQFGPSDQDMQTITSWLQSHGFQLAPISNGRTVIEFSGTAAQVQETFHTAIHKYSVPIATGAIEDHWANSTDPSIPSALAPVVIGVRSLHNFRARPMNHFAGVFHRDKESGKMLPSQPLPIPQFTPGSGYACGILGGPCELLGPYDLATIYNVSPLWNAATPIDGTGQTIAIVGETDILPADWTDFWSAFGVTTPKGSLKIIPNGPDPGFQSDETEADIDTQWSSAVAKGATIDFVVSESTEATLGVDLSAEFIVDNNLAPVMSESYGVCELFVGTAGNAYYNALWQQASAQGISVFISAGDQGSAVCDRGELSAQDGLAVNGFGSTPYNIAVGGTDFNDLTTTSKYWSVTNNSNQANAKGYIPEMTWNDTCTNSEIFPYLQPLTTTAEQSCNNPEAQQGHFLSVTGGSGGASNCTSSTNNLQSTCSGGYAKPSWQNAPGVPADGQRDVPDVSLFASNGFNNASYIVCQSDATGPCNLSNGDFAGYGGTSVSSPIFAGIMALINQKTGERQGNANYVFYKMAATASNSCNSNTVPSTGTNNCVFYDIPSGSTIAVPCTPGSPNCTTSTSGDQFGVLAGYSTTSGYDLATGLGSVNVNNLVTQWSTYAGQFKATKFSSFTLGPPTTITHGQPMPIAAAVVPQTGTGTPTGTIALIAITSSSPSNQQAAQQLFTLNGGSLPANTTTTFLPGGTNYSVTAHYSGDPTFAPSDSSPLTVTVNPEPSKSQVAIPTFDPTTGLPTNPNATSFTYGSLYVLRSNVTNTSGKPCAPNGIEQYACPTGTVTLKDTFNGATNPIDAGSFTLNNEGYTEDQAVFLLGGQHSIVASYSGDPSYNASNNLAAPDVVTVTKAPTTISLGTSTNIIQTGGIVTLTVTIGTQAFLPPAAPAAEYPADNVQFVVGSTPIAGQISYISAASQSGTAQVTAYLGTNSLPVGNDTITAQFFGDTNYSASALSNSVNVDVVIPTTTTLTTSSPTIQRGASVTFTAAVTPNQPGGPAMTGTVQFTSNGANLGGTLPLVNSQAKLTTTSLPAGAQQIFANYSGDSNYSSSSASVPETVNLIATTTAVTTSNAAIQQGSSVTFTATVTPIQSGPTLTGTVQFSSGNGNIGTAVNVVNGTAAVTTTTLPAGNLQVQAYYSGDSNDASSTGSVSEQVAAGSNFNISFAPPTVNVTAPGASATTVLTVTGTNGYNGAINFSPASCAGLPSESSCSFSPASVTGSGTTTLTVSTTAPSSLVPVSRRIEFGGWRTPAGVIRLVLLCAAVFALGIQARRRRWNLVGAALVLTLLIANAACGGGDGGGTGPANPGTPKVQNQLITLMATSGTITHTFTFTLNVN